MRKRLITLFALSCVIFILGFATVMGTVRTDVNKPSQYPPFFLNGENGRLASELVNFCKSVNPAQFAYCEGYIEGAMHFWRYSTARASMGPSDRSFCAGVESARKEINEITQACKDCNLHDELKTAMVVCWPDEYRDKYYCSGYNTEVAGNITSYSKMLMYTGAVPINARNLGLADAGVDVFIHLYAGTEGFPPWLPLEIDLQQFKNTFLKFIHDNPEQRGSSAIIALEKAFFYSQRPGQKPHMEHCTTWDHEDGRFGTENTCDVAVAIQLKANSLDVIELQLNPGEAFRMDLFRSRYYGGTWIFTICPVGYVSSVPLLTENEEIIRSSCYSCIKK